MTTAKFDFDAFTNSQEGAIGSVSIDASTECFLVQKIIGKNDFGYAITETVGKFKTRKEAELVKKDDEKVVVAYSRA